MSNIVGELEVWWVVMGQPLLSPLTPGPMPAPGLAERNSKRPIFHSISRLYTASVQEKDPKFGNKAKCMAF